MSKYQGCTNCKFQPAPLQSCNWLKVQTVYHTICPKWKPKNTDVLDTNVGKWIPTGNTEEWFAKEYACSVCGGTMLGYTAFCPDCGAKMESED